MKVSVLVPTYNRAHFLHDALMSIMAQTHKDLEIIVYDDGSTDHTEDIVTRLHDLRIRYYRNPSNRGVAHARNVLLDLCETEVACWQDSDDLSHPMRIEDQLDLMDQYEKQMIYGAVHWFKSIEYPKMPNEPETMHSRYERCNASLLFEVDKSIRFDEGLLIGEDNAWREEMQKKHSWMETEFIWYYIRRHRDRLGITKGR